MKKLNKRNAESFNSVETYYSMCMCVCHCQSSTPSESPWATTTMAVYYSAKEN